MVMVRVPSEAEQDEEDRLEILIAARGDIEVASVTFAALKREGLHWPLRPEPEYEVAE